MARSPSTHLLVALGIACVLILTWAPAPVAAGCYGSGQYGRQDFGRSLVSGFCSRDFPSGETTSCANQPNPSGVAWYLRARNSCGNIVRDPTQCAAAMNQMIACDGGNGDTRGGNLGVGCMEYVADPNRGSC
ncbi:hypothetical protein M758_4G106500 [Ceratodon purpureus]|uniref:Uncharacterized protein n=1 Tax=Ceratodon purpureus TaxID=3225 RepID=A0A8T0I9G3_CERPU|nr:hypothetical protein KC19_4G107700 [Ceratodon purpureus]KAG0618978.1 hypothetical protein M758_4G106300 [Ceratodon purpureus]KAG0618980.1 hypothetical protein M758_4G106500 [Ceratodon purpureus]